MVSSAEVVAAVLASQVLHVLVQAARPFEWEQTPGFPLIQPAIAPLSDNKFLVAGGINGDRLRVLSAYVCKGVNASPSNCTEIAKLPFDIEVMGAAPLGNQSVLVSGITETGPGGAVYDGNQATWKQVDGSSGSYPPCVYYAVSSLGPGKALLVGGQDDNAIPLAHASVFDASTGQWVAVSSMITPRSGPSLVELADGRALVLGGATSNGRHDLWTAQSSD